uniref:NADH-ubiquinone oxidoreductase chain 2 n=1 Tax=Proteus anguinus TaxID=221568 RepID=Q2TF25_PROAG|nr:NADH dehydrogenase subunit 2 [Proteus anguinus]
MNPYATSVMLSSLSIGTLMTFISNHWFLAWMGLEINTLAILPLMTKTHHPRATEAATKYFLIQAAASALILFATLMNLWLTGTWTIMQMHAQVPTNLMTIALLIKLGVAPFHLWLPDILQGLDLTTGLILSTWQKLAPMIIIFQVSHQLNHYLLLTTAMLSILLGGWGGLNQPQLRKMMAYSSIAHLGWMMLVLTFMPNLTMLNLMIYLLMTSSVFFILMKTSSTTINKLTISWLKAPLLSMLLMISLMSIAGLPPMSGFMPKWLIIQEMTKQSMTTPVVIATILSLLSLFFYLRLSYAVSLTTAPNMSNMNMQHKPPMNSYILPLSITLSTLLLPITPMLTSLLI